MKWIGPALDPLVGHPRRRCPRRLARGLCRAPSLSVIQASAGRRPVSPIQPLWARTPSHLRRACLSRPV